MTDENAKMYLQMLGQALQAVSAMGEILIADEGIAVLLDIEKPEERVDIDAYMAYLRGDGPPIQPYTAISDYFGGKGMAIHEAAATIAEQEGLSADWLNDAFATLFSQHPSTKWLEYPGLRIYIAPTDYLLAMKIAACASSQDVADAKTLAQKLHINNAQDVLSTLMRYIPEALITPEMRLLIEQLEI